mmetsp:Transcript_31592/g.57430  ORF Transcript_31592/g.57430 Transcript_31592/m.57430 type:complete len:309 (-) Transcript_31592:311-1237(-)
MLIANQRVAHMPPAVQTTLKEIWDSANNRYTEDSNTVTHATPGVMTRRHAVDNARAYWHKKVDEAGLSREAFALAAYKRGWLDGAEQERMQGNVECWDLCFQELCHLYATRVVGKEVVTVTRGGGVGLHCMKRSPNPLYGPVPIPAEQTQHALVLNNLKILARLLGPSDGGDLAHVPRGTHEPYPVDKIRWTHKDPSDHFKDGRPISSTVDDLDQGRVQLDAPFLVLDIVEFAGVYWSIRNRRLAVLKFLQDRWRRRGLQHEVHAHVQMLPITHPSVLHKFVEGFSTQTWGQSIELRVSSKTRFSGQA